MTRTIFVSSVQSEFATERRAIKDYITGDRLLSQYFEVFLFEDTPAQSRGPQEVFLDEVDECFIYVGLFGEGYGYEDAEGVSPTEREFDRAVERRKERLVFLKEGVAPTRHIKEKALVAKAERQLTRRTFVAVPDLQANLYASLVDILETEGLIKSRPVDARASDADLNDLDERSVQAFVERASTARNFTLKRAADAKAALAHLNLINGDAPNNAGVLLFAPSPKRFLPSAIVTCLQFPGTEPLRPILSQNVFDGPLFEQIDRAVSFVMARLARPVGVREAGSRLDTTFEIPQPAIAEAIVNAVAHRDYASRAATQVRIFIDRVEVSNPGHLPRGLTPEHLKRDHPSIPTNPLVADILFLAGYVERAGTGTLDMVDKCRAVGLPDPDFFQDGDQWVVRLWRDWLTEAFVATLVLTDRQRRAILHVKANGWIDNRTYQQQFAVSDRTAARELKGLAEVGVLVREGETGRATRYRRATAKPASYPPNPPTAPSRQTRRKPAKPATSVAKQ